MDFSLGFLVVLFLIIFPGLIYRRLYFYGEFSKEFKSGYNLISLIAISTIPGLVNLICIFFLYDKYFNEIDLGKIIDIFKDIKSEDFRFKESNDTPIRELLKAKAIPFIGFLYITSFLLGAITGRFIRITRIDTKYKLLRFKNYWFYLFNGQHTSFKKMRHLRVQNKKHVFTKADILIDSNSDTHLYSGIVVDYELFEDKCDTLSKVMLQNAQRYSLKDNKRIKVEIPGNLLVVDCTSMININLTYVYEKASKILESRIPGYVDISFGLLILFLIPFFIFKASSLEIEYYKSYFDLIWYNKIIAYLLFVQLISVFNPFVKNGAEYKFVNIKNIIAKVIWIATLAILFWILL